VSRDAPDHALEQFQWVLEIVHEFDGPVVGIVGVPWPARHGGDQRPKSKKPTCHANISTTKIYARRNSRSEDSPTFKVRY
jgi:hypothetical protein